MAWTQQNMPSFSANIDGTPTEGLWTPTVDQKHRLGAGYTDGHGRLWRYCQAGATALYPALMTSSEAPASGIFEEAQTAYTTAIGDTSIRVLATAGSGITDGQLNDGWLIVNKLTGLGHAYPIAKNTWIVSDTVMHLELYDPIRVATVATTEMTMRKNLYQSLIVNGTTPTAIAMGVPNMEIPVSYYGWVQRRGPCAMTVDTSDTLIIGAPCGAAASVSVAGTVGLVVIATNPDPIYGRAITIGAGDETALINLELE